MNRDLTNGLAWWLYQSALGWRGATLARRQQLLEQWQQKKSVRAFYRGLARDAVTYLLVPGRL